MANCGLCGEPMPPGEEMFNYHGYSGPCPKPSKYEGKDFPEFLDQMQRDLASIKEPADGGPMARARKLVRGHIQRHGQIPETELLIEEVATELALMEIRGADTARASR